MTPSQLQMEKLCSDVVSAKSHQELVFNLEKALYNALLRGKKVGLCVALNICADGGGFATIGHRVNNEIDEVDKLIEKDKSNPAV